MSSVYLHSTKKSPYWIAVFSDENGRQRHRSTRQTDRSRALATAERYQRVADGLRLAKRRRGENAIPASGLILEMFIEASQQAAEGTFTMTRARQCVDHLMRVTGQAEMAGVKTADYLAGWLESQKATVSEGTHLSYTEKIRSFLEFLGPRSEAAIDSIDSKDVQGFRDSLVASHLAPTTINLKMTMISTPFRAAKKHGYLAVNPFELIKPLPGRNATRDAFTHEQLRSLLSVADEDWRGMILVGACTGMRISDAATLTWKKIDLERGTIRFFPQKSMEREGAKELEVIILPDLQKYLITRAGAAGPSGDRPLFPKLSETKTSGEHGLSLTFRELMKRAEVEPEVLRQPEKGSRGRRVYSLGFHSLRHSCTSIMANCGVPEEIRKKLIGHTSDVHDRYTHFDIATFRRELRKFPSLLGTKDKKTPPRRSPSIAKANKRPAARRPI